MVKSKTFLLCLMLILGVVGLMAGCSSKEKNAEPAVQKVENTQTNDAKGEKEVVLRFMSWDSGDSLKSYQAAIDRYMELHPNITVKTESVPDNFDQKLLTSLASNTAPDVFMAWDYPQYVPTGAIEPLDDYIKKDNLDMSQYYDIITKYVQFDGKTWGLPTTHSPRAIYFNKQLFDDAGVAYPKDGWSWDEFLETVKKLTKPGQYGFISTPEDFFTMQVYFWSNGGDLISEDGKKIDGIFNSPKNVETLKFLKNLYDISAKQSTAGKFSTNNGLEAFKTGNVAMFDNGMWPIGDIVKEGKLKLGTVTHPIPPGGTVKGMIHTSGYSMPAKGEHKDEAWELIKFMSGPEGSKIVIGDKFGFSAIKSVDEASGFAQDEYLKPFTEELKNADIPMTYIRTAKWSKAEPILKQAVQEILVNNAEIQKTLDKAAKDAEEAIQ